MLVARYGLSNSTIRMAGPARRGGRKSPADSRQTLCFVLAALIVVVGVGLTSAAASIVEAGYRIGTLKTQIAALHNENEALEVEVARLQSLSRVQGVAGDRLGMIPPGDIRVARLDPEWQAALAQRDEASNAVEEKGQAASVFGFFSRIASGARTAQARPAR